nr:MAG TPA: hypothetical protein [Caudoviricetes sp.]
MKRWEAYDIRRRRGADLRSEKYRHSSGYAGASARCEIAALLRRTHGWI